MGVHHRRPDGQMGRQQGMSRLSRLSDWKWKVERNCFFNNLLTLTKFRKLAPPPVRRPLCRPKPAALESTPAEEGGCPSRVKNLPDIIGQMTD